MIDHTGIGVANVARSAAFCDAALGALGLRRVMQLPENDGADGVGYGVDYPVFWIDRFHPTRSEAAYGPRGQEPRRGSRLPRGRHQGGRDRQRAARASQHRRRLPAGLLRRLRARSGWQQYGGGLPRNLNRWPAILARQPLLGEALSFRVVHQRRMIKR